MVFAEGFIINNRYKLSSLIATGGMGEVWLANDELISRNVAIKILKSEFINDENALQRFREEAKHAALVNNPSIATIYDYGEQDGCAYIVMEFIRGESLALILEKQRRLDYLEVLNIIEQIASALETAHSAGIIHRDIKPANLIITPDKKVKLTDFGISRLSSTVSVTAAGHVMGTVQYLSPEQASGKPATPLSDIYSLGIVAYEALAGFRPFNAETQVSIALAQINEMPPALPSDIPAKVSEFIMQMIDKTPALRPQSATVVKDIAHSLRMANAPTQAINISQTMSSAPLLGATNNLTVSASSTLPGEVAPYAEVENKKQNKWLIPLIIIIAILLVIAIVGIILAVNSSNNNKDNSDEIVASEETNITTQETFSLENNTSSLQTEDTAIDDIQYITIEQNAYVGQDINAVRAILNNLGLSVNTGTVITSTPSQDQKVHSHDSGRFQQGDTVNINYYVYVETNNTTTTAPTDEAGTEE